VKYSVIRSNEIKNTYFNIVAFIACKHFIEHFEHACLRVVDVLYRESEREGEIERVREREKEKERERERESVLQ
tara:strand:+ start:795 stop:1016 length:222 start_codon:yes stop_codon:yes gene_type:complete